MVKRVCKDNQGFSLTEVIVVLFIISSVLVVLAINPLKSYEKYKERIAVNEIVSDIYYIQTKSLANSGTNYINFSENSNTYELYYDSSLKRKNIGQAGLSGVGDREIKFRYKKGNVNIANTILVKFKNSRYKIIVHLETGYVTLQEM